MQNFKHPWWVHLIRVLCVLAILVALFFLGVRLYFRLPVRNYYQASERGFIIPGCSDDFIAQGIVYDEKSGCFLVNGYQKDGIASPIHFVAPVPESRRK